jgi:hypothetical protein
MMPTAIPPNPGTTSTPPSIVSRAKAAHRELSAVNSLGDGISGPLIGGRRVRMKKVRYALGATAALAPAAMGMAPATAHAATTSNAVTSGKVKTVSLGHSAVARASCTGANLTTLHVNSLITNLSVFSAVNGAHAGSVCVGTMRVQRHFKNNNCVNIRFTVRYLEDVPPASKSLTHRCGNAGSTKTFGSAFRQWFHVIGGTSWVSACVSSTYTHSTCVQLFV